jgi:hypothetical protein
LIFFFFNFSCIFSAAKRKTLKEKEKTMGEKPTRAENGPNLTQKQLKKPDMERKSKGKIGKKKTLRKPYGGWAHGRRWWSTRAASGGTVVGLSDRQAKPKMELDVLVAGSWLTSR